MGDQEKNSKSASFNKSVGDGRNWRIKSWFPSLSDELASQLRVYHLELIRFNGRINLISSATEKNADQIHFADALLGGKIVLSVNKSEKIYDIGSGNGIPGLVMAAMAPTRSFVLIDKDARKIEFIRHVAARMSLKNVSARQTRVEELEPESIQCAVNRGFANISKTVVGLRKYCAMDSEVFHFKSNSWVSEVGQIPSQLCSIWAPSLVGEYELPNNGPKLSIVSTKKIG